MGPAVAGRAYARIRDWLLAVGPRSCGPDAGRVRDALTRGLVNSNG